ncbi:MAG: hypothetical protein U0Q22_11090 [Acidimicrobiales bacterium]
MAGFPRTLAAGGRILVRATLLSALMVTSALAGEAGPASTGRAAPVPTTTVPTTTVPTRVEGISIERSSVEAPAPAAPAAAAPAAAAPAAAAPDTVPTSDAALRAAVLARIPFDWVHRLPGWRIEFLPPRAGYRGSTFPRTQTIQIYRRDGLTLDDYVHVTAHELGHAVDVSLLDDADHRLWNLTRSRDADAGWWVASGADDFSSGAGDWAECFAWSQMPRGRFYSELGAPPDAEQLRILHLIVG